MFAALCSWTYNLGIGALQRSSLRGLYLNEEYYEEAAAIDSRSFYFYQRVVRFLLHTRSYRSRRMDVDLVDHYVVSNSVEFWFVHLLKRTAGKGRP